MSRCEIPLSDSVRAALATARPMPPGTGMTLAPMPPDPGMTPMESLVAALGQLTAPERNGTVDEPDRAYRYVRLDDLDAACRPVLAQHGWAWTQQVTTTRGMVTVITTLIHRSGHTIVSEPLDLPCPRFGLQDIGTAATYGRRYQLAAMLGLPANTDNDAGDQRPGQATAAQKQQIWEMAAAIWPDLDAAARTDALRNEVTEIANADLDRLTDTQAALVIAQLTAVTDPHEEETND